MRGWRYVVRVTRCQHEVHFEGHGSGFRRDAQDERFFQQDLTKSWQFRVGAHGRQSMSAFALVRGTFTNTGPVEGGSKALPALPRRVCASSSVLSC